MIQATDAARRALADLLARSPEPGRTARLLIDDYT